MVLKNRSQLRLAVCLALAVIVFAIYARTVSFPFLQYDDGTYVANNPHIHAGITPASIRWAFTTAYAANWHPLTWLSHALDWQIWGENAAGHHLTNVLFHTANTLLLFLLLSALTGSVWRSALVAALFGVHPLHVESVAWIAERKDVLSTFFMLLAIWGYHRYTQDGRKQHYALSLLAFALGMLSKQMVVSLPVLLLLLDYWPLGRLNNLQDLKRRFVEKIPFFAVAACGCAAAVLAQGALDTTRDYQGKYTLLIRLDNAVVSYVMYLVKTVWPTRLAAVYSHPVDTIPPFFIAASAAALALATAFAVRVRRHGYVVAGWFWYLISLLPVIGIVQLCDQARADRYTYIPLIGIFVIIVWGAAELLRALAPRVSAARAVAGGVSAIVILTLSAMAFVQAGYWQNRVLLFKHAVEVSPKNYVGLTALGVALRGSDRNAEGIECIKEALRIRPDYVYGTLMLGDMLFDDGNFPEAERAYRQCGKLVDSSAHVHEQLGRLLAGRGRLREACEEFATAVRKDPKSYSARFDYATALDMLGRSDEALLQYQAGADLKPDIPQVHRDMAFIHFKKKDYAAAWREVHLCLKYSGSVPPDFMVLLASKMPEPQE